MTIRSSGPLAGVRVLDLAGDAGVFVGRALAELGADVIRPEAGPDRVRQRQPFLDGIAGPERSLYHLHFNAGKRSVRLDPQEAAGRAGLRALATAADIVVATPAAGEPVTADLEQARAANPALICLTLTPYAPDGPDQGGPGSDLTAVAAGGLMYLNGFADGPPLRPGAEQGHHMGALVGLATSLLALAARERDPRRLGRQVEVSLQEAVSMATLQTANANLYTWHGLIPRRRGLTGPRGERSLFECQDGRWTSFTVPLGAPALWDAFTAWVAELGISSPFDASEWSRPDYRFEHAAVTTGIIDQLCRRYDRDELFHEGQRRRMLVMPASTAADLAGSEHLAQRSFFATARHEHLGRDLTDVGPPYRFSATPARVPRRAPQLGEHTAEVAAELAELAGRQPGGPDTAPAGAGAAGAVPARAAPARAGAPGAAAATPPGRLLEGIRVADFCWLIAGPSATRMLADYGADVIKIESRSRLDTIRAVGVQPPEPGPAGNNGVFNDCNTSKRSVTLNLGDPRGVELARELVRNSDVVTNNFTGDRMDRWGLGYDDLRKVNPGVIMLTMPALGATGPYRRYGSYGNGLIAFSGLNQNMGLAGDPPVGMAALYSDFSAPYAAVAAIAAALYHRERTGEGQFIELAQAEATMNLLGTDILEYTANGDLPPRLENRSRDDVPHGAYPCAGEDRWCAIAVRTDGEWRALAEVIGGSALAADPRFASVDGRREHEDDLDALIAAWARGQDAPAAARRLREAGVPAHVVADLSDLLDPAGGVRDRHIVPVERDGLTLHTHAQPALIDGQRAWPRAAAPALGEHNAEVFTTLLGLTDSDVADLTEAGVIY
jgi:crotonobetainyl-CoA:carnitine CoA-transferase CaiB-like acyl-CoA transferase